MLFNISDHVVSHRTHSFNTKRLSTLGKFQQTLKVESRKNKSSDISSGKMNRVDIEALLSDVTAHKDEMDRKLLCGSLI
jgi:phosphoenolpyruvate carboxylase